MQVSTEVSFMEVYEKVPLSKKLDHFFMKHVIKNQLIVQRTRTMTIKKTCPSLLVASRSGLEERRTSTERRYPGRLCGPPSESPSPRSPRSPSSSRCPKCSEPEAERTIWVGSKKMEKMVGLQPKSDSEGRRDKL